MDIYQQPYAWISFGLGCGLAGLTLIVQATKRVVLGALLAHVAFGLGEPGLGLAAVEAAILSSVALTLALGGFVLGVASQRKWGLVGSLLCIAAGWYWLVMFIGAGL